MLPKGMMLKVKVEGDLVGQLTVADTHTEIQRPSRMSNYAVAVVGEKKIRSGRVIGFDRNRSLWELVAEALKATGIKTSCN